MTQLTLYFCSLCKEPRQKDLEYEIRIFKKGAATSGMSKGGIGDICEKCYGALTAKLEEKIDLFSLLKDRTDKKVLNKDSKDDDKDNKDDDGIAIIPSSLTPNKVRELNRSKSEECEHSTGFSMEDDGPHCKDCGEKVFL